MRETISSCAKPATEPPARRGDLFDRTMPPVIYPVLKTNCAEGREGVGWLSFMKHRILIAGSVVVLMLMAMVCDKIAASRSPSLVLSFSHYSRIGNANYAVVELKNVGNGTACYYGFGPNDPTCQVMVDCGKGWVRAPGLETCGTGTELIQIPPGGMETVHIRLHTNQTLKVGMNYYGQTLSDRLPEFIADRLPSVFQSERLSYTTWSSPIPYANGQ